MTLYSIYADSDQYRKVEFDKEQMFEDFGSLRNHFDVNFSPKPIALTLKRPLMVNFLCENTEYHGDVMPDITEHYGRLFLNQKAYDILHNVIKDDGEFLPVIYSNTEGYIFNPLQVAESVEGLNQSLSLKDEYGNRKSIVFYEDRVREFKIFKTKFDSYINSFIQLEVKELIEENQLKGVYFTEDLGDPFSAKYSEKLLKS
ncbi:hypothetical protein [Marinibactrum halimedae]|uniref:Uncharacterized protein n=1 Tax=Marinibactrum halimedae TaxID=1444977 RepID=A0AA37WL20_9GAMM|nr:hypothetical protein [Marinibactrum halimedae]MCD9457415.1 hypothetical protein [Marinibactrum halimedae]GLS25534.1 hypothetical protein GCM10007877_12480 [Marinibactrum halimedae]